jgi:hypothetical protein
MSTKYIPPYHHIKQQFSIATVKGEPWASIRINALEALFSRLLHAVEVDEAWYLTTYPDVAAAIEAKTVGSARAHFVSNGYFEGRRPFPMPVDEIWYGKEYGDIGQGIAAGEIASAAEHFEEFGYAEGRLPAKVI